MDRLKKLYISLGTLTLLIVALALSACDTGSATSTPIEAASPTTAAQAPLGVDATRIPAAKGSPSPTREVQADTPTVPVAIITAVALGTPTVPPEGIVVADMGFRPQPDGYSFENYAGKKKNGKPVPELDIKRPRKDVR